MQLPIVIHKEKNSSYGVTVPDIPGCHSSGDTKAQAISNIKKAIISHLKTLMEFQSEVRVTASTIEEIKKDESYKGALVEIIDIDLLKALKGKDIPKLSLH
jgi:predicted RNase H-like HicB family nuclease